MSPSVSQAILRYLANNYRPELYSKESPILAAKIDYAMDAYASYVYKVGSAPSSCACYIPSPLTGGPSHQRHNSPRGHIPTPQAHVNVVYVALGFAPATEDQSAANEAFCGLV